MRFLIYLFLAYVAYRVIKALLRPRKEVSPGEVIDEMVKCTFCETYVPRRESVKKIVEGETRHFCSEECATKYIEESPKQNKPE
jgi:YHS domain-containing protein